MKKRMFIISMILFSVLFSIMSVNSKFWDQSKILKQTKLQTITYITTESIEKSCPLPSWTVCERGECVDYHFYWLYAGGKKVGWSSGPSFTTDIGGHEYYIRIPMDEALLYWHTVTSKEYFTGRYEIKITNPTSFEFDFGPSSSPVCYGCMGINNTILYSDNGIVGWDSITNLEAVDNADLDESRRDLIKSTTDHTFMVNQPNGNYSINMIFYDDSKTHDFIDVYAENVLKINNLNVSPAYGWPTLTFNVEVLDGRLDIRFHNDGGSDPYWIVNYMSITNTNPNTNIENLKSSITFNGSSSKVFEPSYVYGEESIYNHCAIMWVNFTQKVGSLPVKFDIPIEYKTYIIDFNRDNKIDVYDAIIFSNEYGQSWGSPGSPVDQNDYTWRADINSDGIVNVLDATILRNQFGTNYTAPMFENNGLLNIWEADWSA